MTSPYLAGDLQLEEGLRTNAYPDPLSGGAPWTIGCGHIGREVHPGLIWTPAQCLTALAGDIGATSKGLDTALPWWRTLSDLRQDCLCDMAFNLGVHGLLGFTTYLRLVQDGKYAAAADDDIHTAWAKQVGHRAVRIADQMRMGIHQPY
jgi:lysozyme